MPSLKKKTYVEDLSKFLSNANHFALVKFENTTHQAFEQLRKDLKKEGATFKVVKNALFEKAVEKLSKTKKHFKDLKKKVFPLKENSAILTLGENYHKGLSAFFKFKKNEQTLSFKFGLMDTEFYPSEKLEKIAQLPDKETLITRIIGSIKSPSIRLVYSLKFNINKLVYILHHKAKQTN